MADINEIWELSDDQLSLCITKCHERFVKATDPKEAIEWEKAMATFLQEQRHRQELMLKDETEAITVDLEQRKFNESKEQWSRELEHTVTKEAEDRTFEERKLKWQSGLKIGEIVATLAAAVATGYSAWAGLKGKKIEYAAKERSWERICEYEDAGEIPLSSANKFIKL